MKAGLRTLPLPLFSSLLTNTWLTYSSEEASPANPRRVFLVLQAKTRAQGTSLMMPRHRTKKLHQQYILIIYAQIMYKEKRSMTCTLNTVRCH